MKMFDTGNMEVFGYDQRSRNVFHETPEFKMRLIDLPPGGSIPVCEMASHVIFVCVDGEAFVTVDGKEAALTAGQGVVTEPATVSMRTNVGTKLLGVQIVPASVT
jgi:quercetin dioxygenase-like cupin family protein